MALASRPQTLASRTSEPRELVRSDIRRKVRGSCGIEQASEATVVTLGSLAVCLASEVETDPLGHSARANWS